MIFYVAVRLTFRFKIWIIFYDRSNEMAIKNEERYKNVKTGF